MNLAEVFYLNFLMTMKYSYCYIPFSEEKMPKATALASGANSESKAHLSGSRHDALSIPLTRIWDGAVVKEIRGCNNC